MPKKYLIINKLKNQLKNDLNKLVRDIDLLEFYELHQTKNYFLQFATIKHVPFLEYSFIMRIIE